MDDNPPNGQGQGCSKTPRRWVEKSGHQEPGFSYHLCGGEFPGWKLWTRKKTSWIFDWDLADFDWWYHHYPYYWDINQYLHISWMIFWSSYMKIGVATTTMALIKTPYTEHMVFSFLLLFGGFQVSQICLFKLTWPLILFLTQKSTYAYCNIQPAGM